MANSYWLDSFPDYEVHFLSPEFLYHCAGLLTNKAQVLQKNSPFKIFNYLIKHRYFLSEVQRAWIASSVHGTQMF